MDEGVRLGLWVAGARKGDEEARVVDGNEVRRVGDYGAEAGYGEPEQDMQYDAQDGKHDQYDLVAACKRPDEADWQLGKQTRQARFPSGARFQYC